MQDYLKDGLKEERDRDMAQMVKCFLINTRLCIQILVLQNTKTNKKNQEKKSKTIICAQISSNFSHLPIFTVFHHYPNGKTSLRNSPLSAIFKAHK
jgi:hypothetical protein